MIGRLGQLALFGCLTFVGTALPAESVQVIAHGLAKPAVQPQVAVDNQGGVFVAFGAGEAVYCARGTAGSLKFEAPVKIGEIPKLALGKRRGPRIVATGKSVVVTALGHHDRNLLAWRSDDGGRAWQGPQTVNSAAGSAPEGLHSLAAAPDGTLYAVWLDMRAKNGQQVYGAASLDGGATWQADRLIYDSPDEGICPCCQPCVAFDTAGGLHVMWRNELSGARDMYLASSRDKGATFSPAIKLGSGTWTLNACPMDGGGLAGDSAGHLETIWRREKEIFRCTPGQSEVSLGKGEQGWAAAGSNGIYLVWLTARHGSLMMLAPGTRHPTKLADHASDPVVACSPDGKSPVIAVWEQGPHGKIEIRAAVLGSR